MYSVYTYAAMLYVLSAHAESHSPDIIGVHSRGGAVFLHTLGGVHAPRRNVSIDIHTGPPECHQPLSAAPLQGHRAGSHSPNYGLPSMTDARSIVHFPGGPAKARDHRHQGELHHLEGRIRGRAAREAGEARPARP